jgi:tetratricopeptide (TPR) repeat protein
MNRKQRRAAAKQPHAELASAFSQALALHQAGRLAEAEKIYGQILKVQPNHFESLHLVGVIYAQRGNHVESVRQIDLALQINPKAADAHTNRGNALQELKRLDDALASYDKAIALKPDYAEAFNNRGLALQKLKRLDALASYDKALALKPDYAEAFYNRGDILRELKRLEEALASYDKALALKPGYADAFNNRGNVLRELKRLEEALASYDKALALKPDYAEAFNNRGIALQELKRFEWALASYDKALALKPDYAEAFYNRGNILRELQRPDDALANYDKAIAYKSDYVEAHWNEALLRLLTGDFSRGWAKYEWRWRNESLALSTRNFSQPLWLGAEAIDGKTILLHSEQGLGDTIQFCRYVPLVAARGARVILEVERPLHEIMTNLAGATEVISKGDALPDFDFHCPLLSLPLAFGTHLETVPSVTSYLRAPGQTLKHWQARLGPKARPRIGLVWSGRPAHKNDQNRSISLRSLLPLLDIEATFVSLQKDVRSDDAAVLKECNDVLHFGDELKDFSDTAALILQLDLVISVDTSVAHLAGALGKPVWILLPHNPDWRWLLDRHDSPWYPSARLFRQQQFGNWAHVIDQVKSELCSAADYDKAIAIKPD